MQAKPINKSKWLGNWKFEFYKLRQMWAPCFNTLKQCDTSKLGLGRAWGNKTQNMDMKQCVCYTSCFTCKDNLVVLLGV